MPRRRGSTQFGVGVHTICVAWLFRRCRLCNHRLYFQFYVNNHTTTRTERHILTPPHRHHGGSSSGSSGWWRRQWEPHDDCGRDRHTEPGVGQECVWWGWVVTACHADATPPPQPQPQPPTPRRRQEHVWVQDAAEDGVERGEGSGQEGRRPVLPYSYQAAAGAAGCVLAACYAVAYAFAAPTRPNLNPPLRLPPCRNGCRGRLDGEHVAAGRGEGLCRHPEGPECAESRSSRRRRWRRWWQRQRLVQQQRQRQQQQ